MPCWKERMQGVRQRPPAGARVHERCQQLIDVSVEGAVELAVDVVEVAGPSDLAQLAAGRAEGVALHG